MKTSELKALIETQRYMIISLMTSISIIDTSETNLQVMKLSLDKLWESTEKMDESFQLEVKTFDQIIQHGKEILALQKLYTLKEYDNSKTN